MLPWLLSALHDDVCDDECEEIPGQEHKQAASPITVLIVLSCEVKLMKADVSGYGSVRPSQYLMLAGEDCKQHLSGCRDVLEEPILVFGMAGGCHAGSPVLCVSKDHAFSLLLPLSPCWGEA